MVRSRVAPPAKWDGAPTDLGGNSQPRGNRRLSQGLGLQEIWKGRTMLGKIAGAMIGAKIAGRNKGARGAVAGVAVETLARRVIPAIAAAAILGYAFKKAKGALAGRSPPSYPSDESPAPPPG